MPYESEITNHESRVGLIVQSIILVFIILNSLFFIPVAAHAQIAPDLQNEIRGLGQSAAQIGLGEQAASDIDIRVFALRIVKGALSYVGLALVLMLLYGGVLYMTSQGNEEKLGVAKKVITQAAIGTAIILSSYAITLFVNRQLIRAISAQMITQAQHCSTSTGLATCCREWNAYQTELGATMPFVPSGGGAGLTGLEEGTARRQRLAYDNWHTCFERETERAGLDSNLFD